MENIIVVLDFDGTIALGERAKIKYSKEFFALKVDNRHITRDTYPLGREKYEQLMKYVTTQGIMEFDLERGVGRFLRKLYSEGFRFAIVTSRHDTPERPELSACIRYCRHHGLPIDYFHNTNDLPKNVICDRLHARAIIDDTLKKLLELRGTSLELFFLTQTWNSHEHSQAYRTPEIKVVRSWKEFYKGMVKLKERHEFIARKLGISNSWNNLSKIVHYECQHPEDFKRFL
ncbi:hypothetical protein JXB28_01585 [Candidatus Woesearchaeota archaeon]|nr:hypothetical protein [Candidatus Woesearchaeota archaeon]